MQRVNQRSGPSMKYPLNSKCVGRTKIGNNKQLVLDSLQFIFSRISTDTMNQLVEMIGYAGDIHQGTMIASTTTNQQQ